MRKNSNYLKNFPTIPKTQEAQHSINEDESSTDNDIVMQVKDEGQSLH